MAKKKNLNVWKPIDSHPKDGSWMWLIDDSKGIESVPWLAQWSQDTWIMHIKKSAPDGHVPTEWYKITPQRFYDD